MSHLPDASLTTWKPGDRLTSDALNRNFLTLLALLESVAREARTPDPVLVALEKRAGSVEERIDRLEYLTAMHARQRNEKEWAPLSYIGALVTQVNDLRRDMEKAVCALDAIAAQLTHERGDHDRRLARLEQQPEYALQDSFAPLAADHARLALKEHMLLAQIIALRHETMLLRDMTMAKDRQANRLEFAPMSYIGGILQRLNALEAKP